MEGYSEAIGVIDRPEVISYEPEIPYKATSAALSRFSIWNRLLLFAGSVAIYIFGAHVGFAIGWLAGFLLGNTYVKYFGQVYINNLSQLYFWESMPRRAALSCAIVGVIAGVIIVKIIEQKLLKRNIISFLNKGVTDPKVIAHHFATSEKEIQKKVKRLISKERNL
jgi:hypothetical protein